MQRRVFPLPFLELIPQRIFRPLELDQFVLGNRRIVLLVFERFDLILVDFDLALKARITTRVNISLPRDRKHAFSTM